MLFHSYFTTLVGKVVTVELKNDLAITGTLHSVDQASAVATRPGRATSDRLLRNPSECPADRTCAHRDLNPLQAPI